MYELHEATCDCCRTIYRAVNRRHYCSHCDRYYYVCTRCHKESARCPSCSIVLRRKSEPLLAASFY